MKKTKCVITLSYGDCTCGEGGTDKFILSQISTLISNNIHVFSISPFKKTNFWDVLYDKNYMGIFSNNRLKSYITNKENFQISAVFVHHMNNVKLNLIEDILDYFEVPIIFYLHDYYTICPASGLIRKDGAFCGNEFPNMMKCSNCTYFKKANEELYHIQDFISKYKSRLIFVAPSEAAKKIWASSYSEYSDKVKVLYHQRMAGIYEGNSRIIGKDDPIRIAFVGYQRKLKGWDQFKNAVNKVRQMNLKEVLFQFGSGNELLPGVEQINIDFKKSMTAMIDALREYQIDIAILWSTWPETYSYTYYESWASNCFIVTNEVSGNICDQVIKNGNGLVCDDLTKVLSNVDKLREAINSYRVSNHFVPERFYENMDFIEMIPEDDFFYEPYKCRVFDISCILSYIKKIIRFTKNHLV